MIKLDSKAPLGDIDPGAPPRRAPAGLTLATASHAAASDPSARELASELAARLASDAASEAAEDAAGDAATLVRDAYRSELRRLQVELVKLQRHIIRSGDKVLVLLEGRDAAGKDGSIKRIVKYLSPRESRVVALGKPSDRQNSEWYFQRYVPFLPVSGELVLFNRSWYNRAGVEHVMDFCTREEYESFLQAAPRFEEMLVHAGFTLLKYYLDIGKDEQIRRLADRSDNPLKQWKVSPIDAVAVKHWKAYSSARDAMLLRTHSPHAPWRVVHSDDKRQARLHLMRDLLSRLDYPGRSRELQAPDPDIAFEFSLDCIGSKRLAR
jgi:polyphosphate kinase 2